MKFTRGDPTHPAALISSTLNKREYFAALFMQGIAANPTTQGEAKRLAIEAAMVAVAWADALIVELNKDPQA